MATVQMAMDGQRGATMPQQAEGAGKAMPPAPRGIRRYLVLPLIVLIVALLAFRALGAVGVGPFASWHAAARWALAVMFVFSGSAHFGRMKEALVRMVPPWVPQPRAVVAATGVLEFLGALGLLVPAAAPVAAVALAALLVAMFPANVVAARRQVALGGKPATPLWFRTLVQVIFIAALVWATR